VWFASSLFLGERNGKITGKLSNIVVNVVEETEYK